MKKYIIYLLLFSALVSCTKDFEKINTNPTSPTEVEPSLLLRQVIYNYGDEMSYEGFVAGNLLGQYFTAVDFNLFDRHSLTEPQFGGNPWPVIYKNLRDNEILLQKSLSSDAASVYEGPARIMKAYMTAALTDIYGDVPYSEALLGQSGVVTPSYDRQEDIYVGEGGILAQLDLGINAIDNYSGAIGLEGDLFYQGDLSKWVKLANSLKLKYLMRISSVLDVKQQISELYTEGNFITDGDDDAVFQFSSGQPNNFRMANLRDGDFNLFVMSKTAQFEFQDVNDPREQLFYRPRSFDNLTFNGLRNGPDASETSITISNYSLSGEIFRENTGLLKCNFMTSWETSFLLAEAALRGYIQADVKSFYENGIRQSFDYWDVALPSDYLESDGVDFTIGSGLGLGRIITQKWLSNIINGYESWIEYRRTGHPQLLPVLASLNNDLIPVRMPYPTDEAALNAVNFDDATAENQNSINSRVWWDIN